MRILVPIRQTVDHNVVVRPLPDGTGPDVAGLARIINPFDEIALEAALQLKEAGAAETVLACAIGPDTVEKALRTALAMGADAAIHVPVKNFPQPPVVAAMLAALAQRHDVALVLMGKQEIEGDFGVVPQMLAGRLSWPQAMFTAAIRVPEPGALEVTCERDEGERTLRLAQPAVVSADLRLAQPRFVSLPNLMKARRKPIETIAPEVLDIPVSQHFERSRMEAAPTERAGEMLASIDELLRRLREKGLWPEETS